MFDIVCQTYDICILRYSLDIDSISNVRNDLRYRDTILKSISNIKYSISMHYDIEETSISNFFLLISTHYDVEETSISIVFIPISSHHDIEETSTSKCKSSILVYTDIEVFLDIDQTSFDIHVRCRSFCFDIEFCVLRYLCFFAWVAVARARYWTHIAV
jgi:hypothetical protein